VDQGEEDTWDTVGRASERRRSPAPTTEATVPEAAQQAAIADEPWALTKERRPKPSSTAGAVEPRVSGILPGYSCKEGGRVEDGLLLEFPCTSTRTCSV
jgi:hypothetical protein